MWRSLYTKLLAPRQQDEDIRNREVVLNVLLAGTIIILFLAELAILYNYLAGMTFVAPRGIGLLLALLFVLGIYGLSRKGHYGLAAWLLVGVYLVLAAAVGLVWSISLPSAVLLYGLVLVLAGILLGPRYSLVGFVVVVLLIIGTVSIESAGIITQDLAWKEQGSGRDEILGLSFMLGIITAVSWLFNYQTTRSLHRAHRAEAALRRQKISLEETVKKRTRQLHEAQLEKIQQLYRFAELGQLSTALLHELANHLTTLTLDIEGLEQQSRSRMLRRAKQSIHYMDDMVIRVRDQLRGKSGARAFDIVAETSEVITILNHKAGQAGVSLQWQPPKQRTLLRRRGDPVRFRQLLANMLSNAIDSYDPARSKPPRNVRVELVADKRYITINLTDWGRGIPDAERAKLFEPFFSTKQTGMGLGLFIARQIAEDHFNGRIALDPSKEFTKFVITLPRTG